MGLTYYYINFYIQIRVIKLLAMYFVINSFLLLLINNLLHSNTVVIKPLEVTKTLELLSYMTCM